MRVAGCVLLLVFCLPTLALSQERAPSFAAKQAAMRKLTDMEGRWQGQGTIRFGERTFAFESSETVERKAGGLAMVITGIHTMNPPGGPPRTIHDALGVISFDPQKKHYRFATHLANGQSGNYVMELRDQGTLVWTIPETAMGTMRYTITIEANRWVEKGEVSRDGKEWTPFFSMELKKQK